MIEKVVHRENIYIYIYVAQCKKPQHAMVGRKKTPTNAQK